MELVQGTDAWRAARAGSLGASQIHEALAKTRSGWGASRDNIRARLVAERLTGAPQDSFTNDAMRWGTDNEPAAREAYCFVQGVSVVEVGLRKHPTISGSHASPDGLVGDDGLTEIKCPNTSTHIATLLGTPIADKYIKQMQWQMRVYDRQWCDFVSYDPRMPLDMQLHIARVDRDDALIAELEAGVTEFLAEVERDVAALTNQYRKAA
jgi:putative phage-type endonuclease